MAIPRFRHRASTGSQPRVRGSDTRIRAPPVALPPARLSLPGSRLGTMECLAMAGSPRPTRARCLPCSAMRATSLARSARTTSTHSAMPTAISKCCLMSRAGCYRLISGATIARGSGVRSRIWIRTPRGSVGTIASPGNTPCLSACIRRRGRAIPPCGSLSRTRRPSRSS